MDTWTWMNTIILYTKHILMTIYMECNSYLIRKNSNTITMINVSTLNFWYKGMRAYSSQGGGLRPTKGHLLLSWMTGHILHLDSTSNGKKLSPIPGWYWSDQYLLKRIRHPSGLQWVPHIRLIKRIISATGNQSQVTRVTGRNTSHYTMADSIFVT